jgi:hypothetical protein
MADSTMKNWSLRPEQGSWKTVFYRQTAGKRARKTVVFRGDWHRRAAGNLARADDWRRGRPCASLAAS